MNFEYFFFCDYGERFILKVKIKSIVKFVWGFLLAGCALSFADQNTYFFAKDDPSTGVRHIIQSSDMRVAGWGASLEASVPTKVADVLGSILNGAQGDISIESDIDLGQINPGENCISRHSPITLEKKNFKINGNGHVIKNMCADISVNPNYRDTLGLFKILDGVMVENLGFENVRFSVTDGSVHKQEFENGKLYAGVGVLAGYVRNSQIDGVTLKSVKLTAPFAGGIAGYAEKSSFSNITSFDQIELRNQTVLPMGVDCAGCGGTGAPIGCHSKVFLGGLAGFAFDLSISDVDISVLAKNESAGSIVAIGGLVGQYGFTADQLAKGKLVVENVKVGARTESSISNAKMMGGFFGEVSYLQNHGEGGALVILNSSFNGEISNAQSSDTAYVGGFIGKDLLDVGGSVKIIKSSSNVDISDAMANEALRYYYVGGLVAWGSTNIGDGSKYSAGSHISFVDSKVSGNISLGNSSATEKMKVFVGGLGGYVPLAHNDSALFADTSNVDINVNMENLVADSVGVGGFIGFLRNNGVTQTSEIVNVQNSVFSGEISVKNTKTKTFAGGIVGAYWGMDNPHALSMKNVFVTGDNLLDVSATGAKVGGICGIANSVSNLDRVAVLGNISVTNYSDSVYVGGLMGSIFSSAMDFNWSNTYFIGNVGASVVQPSTAPSLVGYLAGGLEAKGNGFHHVIKSNYHSGTDNVDAFGAFNGWQQGVTDWATPDTKCNDQYPCWEVSHNVRNGDVENLNAFSNGTLTQEEIQSAYLADFLNVDNAEKPWAQVLNENGNYPFFDAGFTKDPPQPKGPESSSSSEASCSSMSSSSEASSSSMSSSSEVSSSSESSSSAVSSSSRPWKWTMISLSQFKKVSLKRGEILYWWDESNTVGEYLQYQAYDPNNAGDGTRGYWIWTNKELTTKAKKDAKAGESFVWNVDSLNTGWNLVANPFGWSIDVGNLGEDIQVWHWVDTLGYYDTTSVLGAYEGAWVHTGDRKSITVDAAPVTTKKPAAKRVAAEDPSGWSVFATLKDEFGKSAARNIIGVGSAAERWAEPPSGMENDRVSLSIVEGNKRFAKSLKRSTDELQWTIQVKASSDRDGFIKLEGLERVAATGKKLYMIDGNKVTEMKSGKSVRVALKKSAKNITIVASETAPVVASRMVYDMHVDLSRSVNVDFKVVKAAVEKPVRVSLVNALGREVYSAKISAREGVNQLNFGLPQKGMYILTVKVGDDVAAKTIAVR